MKTLAGEPLRADRGRGLVSRLLGRIRHGLLMQELLDRLAAAGLVIYPYFVTQDPGSPGPASALSAGQSIRPLTAQDAAAMVRIDPRYPPEPFIARLTRAECLGLFAGAELVGYSWAKLDSLPMPGGSGAPLFELQSNEAYLFDIYIAHAWRGRRLAEILRRAVHADLAHRGRSVFYGYTLAFNRSPRRLLARAGVRDLELRLFLGLRLHSVVGFDVRLWRRKPHLRSRWLTRASSPRAPQPH